MSHQPVRDSVRAFFDGFARASQALDVAALGAMFGDVFLNLSPTSVGPVTREVFTSALPGRERLFGSIGAIGTALTELSETVLDDMHTLAHTTWRVRFGPDAPADRTLTLSADYLLRQEDGRWRIVAYLNHQDIVAVIRAMRDQPTGAG